MLNNLQYAGDWGDVFAGGATNILEHRGQYLPRGEIFRTNRPVTIRTPIANISSTYKVLNGVRLAGKGLMVVGLAATAWDAGKDFNDGKWKSGSAKLVVNGIAAGAAFIPVVGWGVSIGIATLDYAYGDQFYNWVEK